MGRNAEAVVRRPARKARRRGEICRLPAPPSLCLTAKGNVFFIEMNTRFAGRASGHGADHGHRSRGNGSCAWAFGEKAAVGNRGEITLNGHAIEARVLRGKSAQEFHAVGRPDQKLGVCRSSRAGLRIDAGYRKGDAVLAALRRHAGPR